MNAQDTPNLQIEMRPQALLPGKLRASRPIAMLSLDGGGVRGLSSLLILREQLQFVKEELISRQVLTTDDSDIHPQDVFDIAVGTSTGGLIVLMIVKLDMTIDDCIRQYKSLSRQIFGKERPLMRRVYGSDWSKFSGQTLMEAIEALLAEKEQPLDLLLRAVTQSNKMSGSVLCHERQTASQNFMEPSKDDAVFLCTDECSLTLDGVEMREAARATSAAPSYFEAMEIQGRHFVDGGYGETNNPSWEARFHYKEHHGLSADQKLVMVNIGTGTLPKDAPAIRQRRPWWTAFFPKMMVSAMGLVSDLAKMATRSEKPAIDLRRIAEDIPQVLFFDRFSADTGIHEIKLDDWQAVMNTETDLSEIELKTRTYLNKKDVKTRLRISAKQLADVYIARQNLSELSPSIISLELPDNTSVPDRVASAPSAAIPVSVITEPVTISNPNPGLTRSEPTHSTGLSPPPTPEMGCAQPRPSLTPLTIPHQESFLRGEGGQFDTKDLPATAGGPSSSPTWTSFRAPRRRETHPPRSPRSDW